jgi:hypothetical protein
MRTGQVTEDCNDLVPMPDHGIVARKLDAEEAHRMRGDIVRLLLQQTVKGLKNKLDPVAWLNTGWPELEAFGRGLRRKRTEFVELATHMDHLEDRALALGPRWVEL